MSNLIRRHKITIAPLLSVDDDNEGNPVEKYGDHFFIENVSLNANTGRTASQVYGDRISNMVRTFIDYDKWFGKVKENDRAYLYGATPDGEDTIGGNANYRVVSVLPQNKKIQVLFERLP